MIIMVKDSQPSRITNCYLDFGGDFEWSQEGGRYTIEKMNGYALIPLSKLQEIIDKDGVKQKKLNALCDNLQRK